MKTMTKAVREELVEMIVDTLKEGYRGEACDLHNEVFNTDYFIIGTYKAEEWLKDNYGVFSAVNRVKEYEQDNLGECSTDLSDAEKVCNMLVYILGEEILQESKVLNDNWDKCIDDEIAKELIEELEEMV